MSNRAARVGACLLACALGAGRAEPADAQWPAPPTAAASWMTGWSPLRSVADLERELPAAPPFSSLLIAPDPRIGLFWTAGIPVGVGPDVAQSRADLRVGGQGGEGSYRRALDVSGAGGPHLQALGWRPVGHGAVAGRVVALQQSVSSAGHATIMDPYHSEPFVLADSSLPAMRRLSALLEGSLGWRVGIIDAGLAAGLVTADYRTSEARFARLGRSSTPAVSAGLAIRLPLHLRVAAQGRWVGGSENLILAAQPGIGEVYLLDGYNEPVPGRVEPPRVAYRRVERDADAWGGGVEGSALGGTWVVHVRRERRTHEYASVREADAPLDRWEASGWNAGAAFQVPIGSRFLVTAESGWRTLAADAQRASLEGILFHTDEEVLDAEVEVRYAPRNAGWRLAAAFATRRDHRVREDYIVAVASDILAWTPGARIEGAADFGRVGVGAGFAIAAYTPNAAIPDPDSMGTAFRTLIAQEHALYAEPALPMGASVSAAYRLGGASRLVVEAFGERLARRGAGFDLAYAPTGAYTRWRLDAGFVLDR